ncbi:putative membrane protein [Methanolinea mesophila]|uniref:DUF1616 domain-containing protein n=1 Tax=Methanolinea mesophila TaxID=547055 RepID=UPI001AE34226|nr:DUF1616 domain-containing protein [Methanolinea mesophila]MBP1928077.1 putative membrane protein [Methanolinea mesophila]
MDEHNAGAGVLDAFSPRNTPPDLALVYLWTIASAAVIYIPIVNGTFLRVIIALPMILFFPGYSLICALFPGKTEIDGIERLALSFGLSIAVVPLIGLVLNYTPWGIRLDPLVISLAIFTLAMAIVAQFRRAQIAPEARFSVPFRGLSVAFKAEFFDPSAGKTDRALSVLLLIAIAGALVATAYVIAVPKEGEKFTEFYILGSEGKASDYPTMIRTGDPQEVIVGIGNHEYRNASYFVEVWLLDRESDPASGASSIIKMDEMSQQRVDLPDNQTYQEKLPFRVNETGYNQIQFLLFIDQAPGAEVRGQDRINASYRDLHLWITVRPR